MNKTTFTQDKVNKRLTAERTFNARLELVWRAFTESELLDQWWAPKPWRAETKFMDFREGGHWLYCMKGPNGEAHWGRTEYEKIVPHESFVGKDVFCDEEGNPNHDLPSMFLHVTFQAKGDQTLVTSVTSFPTVEQMEQLIKMGVQEGSAMAHDNLDSLLAEALTH